MLTSLVVVVFASALVGAAAVCACSCRSEQAAPAPQKAWWRAKGLSVYAEPVCKPQRAPEAETR